MLFELKHFVYVL